MRVSFDLARFLGLFASVVAFVFGFGLAAQYAAAVVFHVFGSGSVAWGSWWSWSVFWCVAVSPSAGSVVIGPCVAAWLAAAGVVCVGVDGAVSFVVWFDHFLVSICNTSFDLANSSYWF